MNLKAIFPAGVTAITVNGLHQWDYGRTLEIVADDLPALVEVHFACPGMKEAEVRVCSAANGTASAVIPDRCLEQTAPITAWVFIIDDTAGYTVKTITLPVIARVKPQPGESVPEEHYDRYTELITEVNAVIANLNAGNVNYAAKAGYADEAGHATSAGKADSASTADTATTADNAATADSAGTINKYLHNVGLTMDHDYIDSSTDKSAFVRGHFSFQVITDSPDPITMENLATQVTNFRDPAKPLPCSGHCWRLYDDNVTEYFVTGLAIQKDWIFPVGYEFSTLSTTNLGWPSSSCTLDYDTVIPL